MRHAAKRPTPATKKRASKVPTTAPAAVAAAGTDTLNTLNSTPDDIRETLRDLRKRKRVSMQVLASKIGRSVGFISQVERGISKLTVEDLANIAEVLEVPMTYFYTRKYASSVDWVTRPHERRPYSYASGITDYQASPALSSKFFLLITTLEPGAKTGERDLHFNNENAGYVLEGQLTIWRGEEEMTVYAGDVFQLPSGSITRYCNPGTTVTKLVWIYG
jgi:transcriptional regulator with XRE-family HTH domain